MNNVIAFAEESCPDPAKLFIGRVETRVAISEPGQVSKGEFEQHF